MRSILIEMFSFSMLFSISLCLYLYIYAKCDLSACIWFMINFKNGVWIKNNRNFASFSENECVHFVGTFQIVWTAHFVVSKRIHFETIELESSRVKCIKIAFWWQTSHTIANQTAAPICYFFSFSVCILYNFAL